MSNSWAIIIGINQYQGFQPLMQAQNDAVAIRKYLMEDAGFPPENCILLSDLSTSINREAVYPDRNAINEWLETICQGRVQQDDALWFFFSGYGAQEDNRDFLMPVDGDPAQVKQTGIALQDVVQHLKQAPTKDVMMVLDINRSMSALPGQAIGAQAMKLAQKARIPLMLSCQPDQFSHETLGVRHGIFTAALLEGLRYDGCATLSHLERYLVERVPELSEHHWRPIQNPVVLLPEEQKFQLLWHQRDQVRGETATAVNADPIKTPEAAPGTDADEGFDYGAAGLGNAALIDDGGLTPDNPDVADLMPDNPDFDPDFDIYDADAAPSDADMAEDLIPGAGSELILEDELPEEDLRDPYGLEDNDVVNRNDEDYGTTLVEEMPADPERRQGSIGGCLGALAALISLLLLGAVLFRNQPAVQNVLNQVPPTWLARLGLDSTGDTAAPDEGEDTTSTGAEPAPSDTGSTPGEVTATAPEETANSGNATPDNPDAADGADATETGDQDQPTADGKTGADEDGSEAAGSEASESEPANSDNGAAAVSAVGNTTPGAADTAGGDTATVLAAARRSLNPNQASQFASAIATARKIPSNDPNYADAQEDIRRWSQVILDLAEGRAAEIQLQSAIAAAQLVPQEPADIYSQAQERIKFWQARAQSRTLIREAQAIPRMGQASTYQKGILKLQEVPASQPVEYTDAQRLIGEWTGKMLTIAQARAAQGLYASAIEAANLIPSNTPNYDQAQAEIKRWQGQ